MDGVITFGEMRSKGMTMLVVACRRCDDRRGRLSIDRLLREHGKGVLDLRHHRARLSAHEEPDGLDLRALRVTFPELPKWFLKRSRLAQTN